MKTSSARIYKFLSKASRRARLQAIINYLYLRERELLKHGYSS